jgi:hypothetical protein
LLGKNADGVMFWSRISTFGAKIWFVCSLRSSVRVSSPILAGTLQAATGPTIPGHPALTAGG